MGIDIGFTCGDGGVAASVATGVVVAGVGVDGEVVVDIGRVGLVSVVVGIVGESGVIGTTVAVAGISHVGTRLSALAVNFFGEVDVADQIAVDIDHSVIDAAGKIAVGSSNYVGADVGVAGGDGVVAASVAAGRVVAGVGNQDHVVFDVGVVTLESVVVCFSNYSSVIVGVFAVS